MNVYLVPVGVEVSHQNVIGVYVFIQFSLIIDQKVANLKQYVSEKI